jgi:hypothetical protein
MWSLYLNLLLNRGGPPYDGDIVNSDWRSPVPLLTVREHVERYPATDDVRYSHSGRLHRGHRIVL